MTVAILKIGMKKISFDTNRRITNGNIGEIKQIVGLFININCDIIICDSNDKVDDVNKSIESIRRHFSKSNIEHYSILNNSDMLNADMLVVIGGTTNFFGGCDNFNALGTYKFINEFKGKVIYFYTDPLCAPLKKIGHDKVKTKIPDVPLQIEITKQMSLITCEKKFDKSKNPWKRKNIINTFDNIYHFEFSHSSIFDTRHDLNFNYKNTDLVYGGFYRGGARRELMLEYFFNTDYSSKFFGGIELEQFKLSSSDLDTYKLPEFYNKKGDWDFFKEETNKALATVIFGEDTYQDNIITMRVYYSVLSSTIVFIDKNFDSNKLLFKQDFFYVSSKEELNEKIKKLKTLSLDQYTKLLDYQYSCLNIDKIEYYSRFKQIVQSI